MRFGIAALIAGFLLDLLLGDPEWLYHPVRLIIQHHILIFGVGDAYNGSALRKGIFGDHRCFRCLLAGTKTQH